MLQAHWVVCLKPDGQNFFSGILVRYVVAQDSLNISDLLPKDCGARNVSKADFFIRRRLCKFCKEQRLDFNYH